MIKKQLKKLNPKKKKQVELPPRITNETVAEHREQILSGGRKFKYPLQYAKHKLIFNTLIISVVVLIVLSIIGWWQLYLAQNTSGFFYRVTQVVPLSVANVDGQQARYSDYLREYRSSLHWLERKARGFNINSDDGKRQAERIKRQSLDNTVEAAYAQKLATTYGITISDAEIDQFVDGLIVEKEGRKPSRQAYEQVLSDSYGVSVDEYREMVRLALLKRKVAFEVDSKAKDKIEKVQEELKKGRVFEDIAPVYSSDAFVQSTKGDIGFIDKTTQDGGVTLAAQKLQKNQYSSIIKGTDAYYIVKQLDSNETQVRYARIKVDLKEFDAQLKAIKKQGKVSEYISVKG